MSSMTVGGPAWHERRYGVSSLTYGDASLQQTVASPYRPADVDRTTPSNPPSKLDSKYEVDRFGRLEASDGDLLIRADKPNVKVSQAYWAAPFLVKK